MFQNKSCYYLFQVFISLAFTNIVFSDDNTLQSYSENGQIIQKISVQNAGQMIESYRGNPDFVILDLRTAQEYKREHIENSNNIDFFSDNFKNELDKLDKDKTYIIHCRSGGRASNTLPIMKELGFKEVYNMGGIIQWKEAGFETVKTE
ncbi:MAG: rhodanese-like domain-containing protein [Candidatus Dadabacteria bacterium]|nr:rhodanese-like domain-containing protein [Candidatus Dadabacteria bacterium]NIT13931.1 rhodanese-like domain-containing protein [Candidatus Dadabacteria bacterium]